jgi:hypothetical protein
MVFPLVFPLLFPWSDELWIAMVSYGYGLMDHGSPKSPVVLVFSTHSDCDRHRTHRTHRIAGQWRRHDARGVMPGIASKGESWRRFLQRMVLLWGMIPSDPLWSPHPTVPFSFRVPTPVAVSFFNALVSIDHRPAAVGFEVFEDLRIWMDLRIWRYLRPSRLCPPFYPMADLDAKATTLVLRTDLGREHTTYNVTKCDIHITDQMLILWRGAQASWPTMEFCWCCQRFAKHLAWLQ